jgi:predicted protein tyrosine phosphatase
MINKIIVQNRWYANDLVNRKRQAPEGPWHLISICSRPEENLLIPKNMDVLKECGCKTMVAFAFGDITPEHLSPQLLERYPWLKLFSELQAKAAYEYVKNIHYNKEQETLLIHCDAGISRSGAIGTWACDYLGLNYFEFQKMNPFIHPNPHVLSLLYKASNMNPV